MSQYDLTGKSDQKIQTMMEEISDYSPDFQVAISAEFQRRKLQRSVTQSSSSAVATASKSQSPQSVLLSTGEIGVAYDVVDAVFAYGSSSDGFLKTANPLEAYQKVANVLKERAVAVGGNAVTFATFDYRIAASAGCGGGKAFEVFAYGTAVRIRG